jgi:hypothetical protein
MAGNHSRCHAPPPAPLDPSAFVLCPILNLPALAPQQESAQRTLYEWALAQAQAAAAPSLLERDLLAVWN